MRVQGAATALWLVVTGCISLPASPATTLSWWGFADPSNAEARSALAKRTDLEAALTGWIVIDSATYRPVQPYTDTVTLNHGVARLAFITTYQGGRHRPETIRGLATDRDVLAHGAESVVAAVIRSGYSGIVMDFAGMTVRDLDALLSATRAIADTARAHRLGPIVISVPASDTAGYPGQLLSGIADMLLVLSYDEHAQGTAPGSPASPEWFGRRLRARAAEAGSNRIVAAIPVDGYRWVRYGDASRISFQDATRLLERTGSRIERDPVTHTLHAQVDNSEIWMSDRDLVRLLVRDARRMGVNRFVLWRLGGEDPLLARPIGAQTISRSR